MFATHAEAKKIAEEICDRYNCDLGEWDYIDGTLTVRSMIARVPVEKISLTLSLTSEE